MYQAEGSGCHPGNAAGLPDGDGTNAFELFPHFPRQPADGPVFEPFGSRYGLGRLEFCDRFLLLIEVARKFDLGFDGASIVTNHRTRNPLIRVILTAVWSATRSNRSP